MQIGIGGTTLATQYDQLNVAGNLTLDGSLIVSLMNGFHPVAKESFNILDWAGTLIGTFASLQLPGLSGSLAWNISQLYTSGELVVVDSNFLPGDFNRDHHVDAADILAMEQALVDLPNYQSAKALSDDQLLAIGDLNGDGFVNGADLQVLLNLLKSGNGSTNLVPEPASLVQLVIARWHSPFAAEFDGQRKVSERIEWANKLWVHRGYGYWNACYPIARQAS